jgi:hypothetical protein
MADTMVNLSQVAKALQSDSNILTDVTNICKAINKVSIKGLDVVAVTNNVNVIKELNGSINPILQSLNGLHLEVGKVDIPSILGMAGSLGDIKTATNTVLDLVGEFDSGKTGDLTNKVSSIAEIGVQIASFAASIGCPALGAVKGAQTAAGLLNSLSTLSDGLKSSDVSAEGITGSLNNVKNTSNAVLGSIAGFDTDNIGDIANKVSSIAETGVRIA